MKPTTVLTSSGWKRARHRIGARLQRLLVDAVMRVGRERAALPGLEIHHVVADACRGEATARRRAPRPAARGRRRSSCSRPRCRRSTGTPDRPARRGAMRSSVVVTCASTQLCVGMSSLRRNSSSMASSACARSGLSVAGLMPITASPAPSSRPSRMLAAMPREIVGRMVGLQPHRQPAGQADGVAEARDHRALAPPSP